jgi:hypothetical protein
MPGAHLIGLAAAYASLSAAVIVLNDDQMAYVGADEYAYRRHAL